MKKGKILLVSSLVFFGTLIGTTLTSCGSNETEKEEDKYTVKLSFDNTKGSVKASTICGKVGEKVTLTITPNTGYEVGTIKINGSSVESTTREFTPVKGENTVAVTFNLIVDPVDTAEVTLVQADHGTISASKTSGNVGDEIIVTVTPESGYELDWLKHNNNDITTTKKFNLVKGENKVTVAFKEATPVVETATVTIEETTNGTISVNKTSGNVGEEIIVTVTPNSGYELDWLKHNDTDITETKKFVLVSGENKLTASFKKSLVPAQLRTFYFKDVSWWNDAGASTMIRLYDGDKTLITTAEDTSLYLGEKMTYLNNPGYYEGSNYWSYEIDTSKVYYVQFIRASGDGTQDWGARTDLLEVTSENNFVTLGDTAKWYGNGEYADATWSHKELSEFTREECEVNFVYDDTKGNVTLNGLAFADSTVGFSVTPNEGFIVDTIKINGEEVDPLTRSFDAIKGETYTIEVTFKEGVVETYTLYFKTISELEEWGPKAFAYMFNSATNENNGAWPGVEMTSVSFDEETNTHLWKIEGVDTTKFDTIIFAVGWTDNIVGQTADIPFSDFVSKEVNFYTLIEKGQDGKYVGEWSVYEA